MNSERAATYITRYRQIYGLMILLMLAYYIYRILSGAGGDLMLRVSEAKYFLQGINPYDVYVGKFEPIKNFGNPNAYSFFSYYFAAILSLIDSSFWQKVVYAALDILSLIASIFLLGRLAGKERNLTGPPIFAILLLSVFFWQHVSTLNYNLIVAFGLILVFFGISRKAPFLSLAGMIIIGLKPALALPALVYLVILRYWALLFYTVLAYGTALICTSIWIDTSPIDILLQLKDTQSRFSNGHTDGFFYFLKAFLPEQLTTLGIAISIFVIARFRRHLLDPLNGFMVVIALGLSFFYNHVHAWIIAYPLLAYGIAEANANRISFSPCVLLLLFLIAPRLAGTLSAQTIDTYVAAHNVIRFGLLMVATYYLTTNRYNRRGQGTKEPSAPAFLT